MKIWKKIKSELVKVLFLTFLVNFIKIGINLVTTKVIAVLIGPNGVAVIGQFTNFISTITTSSTGGVTNGVVRYTSEFKDDKKLYVQYLNAAFTITIVFSTLTMIVLLLFAKPISRALFGNLTYLSIIYITALTLFLFSLNSYLLAIINGKKLYDRYIFINLISSVVGFIFTMVLVYLFKVYGALLALATYQSVVIIITLYVVRKNKLLSFADLGFNFNKNHWNKLFAYSMMAIVGLIWPLINISIRTTMISQLSFESAGIWEGMTRISGLITAIVGAAISTYFLPRFSEITENKELKKEVYSGLKIILSATLVLAFLMYVFRQQIVMILYTDQFMSMTELFVIQLTGDVLWVGKMVLSVVLIAKAMMKKYVILEIVFGLVYLVVAVVLLHMGTGTISAPIAHLTYNLLYFIVIIFVFKKIVGSKNLVVESLKE